MYWVGTRIQKLCGRTIVGPKCEKCTNKYEEIFKLLINNKSKLKDIQDMKLKEIDTIIFPKVKKECSYSAIYNGQNKKFVSLNYRIATNILKTAVVRNDTDRACIYCRQRNETVFHIFLNVNI